MNKIYFTYDGNERENYTVYRHEGNEKRIFAELFVSEDEAIEVVSALNDNTANPFFNRDLLTAFKQRSFPVNPIPFLNALTAGVRANGTDWIHSDEAKALLWVVMAQSFKTQIIAISMHEEWKRLNQIF